MSDSGENHGRRSEGSDFFGDEEVLGGLLRNLISSKGLQSAWQGIGRRLQQTQRGLAAAQRRLRELPEEFVARSEYHDTVETTHGRQLAENTKELKRIEQLTAKLSAAVFQDQGPLLTDCFERLKAQEARQQEAQNVVEVLELQSSRIQEEVRARLQEASEAAAHHVVKGYEELKELQRHVHDSLGGFTRELDALEARTKAFMEGEVKRATTELLSFDPTAAETGDNGQQDQMLHFIKQALVEPLQADIAKNADRSVELASDLSRQRETSVKQIRQAERSVVDLAVKMSKSLHELKEDIDVRAKKPEVAKLEETLTTTIGEVAAELQSHQGKVVFKLNEFADHFGSLHETINDHEHCLRHHAEEIENRATKYELLTYKNLVDKCAAKDETNRGFVELRNIVDWQSSKIERLGLTATTAVRPTLTGARKSLKMSQMSSKASILTNASDSPKNMDSKTSLLTRTSNTSTPRDSTAALPTLDQAEGQGPNVATASEAAAGTRPGTPPRQAGVALRRGTSFPAPSLPTSPKHQPLPSPGLSPPTSPKHSQRMRTQPEAAVAANVQEIMASEDSDVSDSDQEDSSSNFMVLRHQLEAVAMGLDTLAHLVLQAPKVGLSRNERIVQQRDLLVELGSLRHWITNRVAPAGWDATRLRSMALQCAHNDHARKSLPQLSLKGNDEHQHRRVVVVDSPPGLARGNGAKMAPAPFAAADTLAKGGPFSARGPSMVRAPSLPPVALGGLPSVQLVGAVSKHV